jgi:CubicO group peptidase (beta-lactamase class C family)
MNSRLIVAIVAASVLSDCTGRPSAGIDARDVSLAADVEAFAARLAAADEFSGVVLLARHGQSLVRRGYGLADRKAGRTNTPETPFALSSVSKMFTAVTIAKLVERKQLSFDSTLGSLLPAYPSAEARDQVTVHHLLTMSSGIPDLFRVPEFWAGNRGNQDAVRLLEVLRNIPAAVPRWHTVGVQQLELPSARRDHRTADGPCVYIGRRGRGVPATRPHEHPLRL